MKNIISNPLVALTLVVASVAIVYSFDTSDVSQTAVASTGACNQAETCDGAGCTAKADCKKTGCGCGCVK